MIIQTICTQSSMFSGEHISVACRLYGSEEDVKQPDGELEQKG